MDARQVCVLISLVAVTIASKYFASNAADKYGKSAGPRRNQQMVVDCDYCILFWDGKSRGTKNDIDLCKKYNKPYKLLVEGEIGARN